MLNEPSEILLQNTCRGDKYSSVTAVQLTVNQNINFFGDCNLSASHTHSRLWKFYQPCSLILKVREFLNKAKNIDLTSTGSMEILQPVCCPVGSRMDDCSSFPTPTSTPAPLPPPHFWDAGMHIVQDAHAHA